MGDGLVQVFTLILVEPGMGMSGPGVSSSRWWLQRRGTAGSRGMATRRTQARGRMTPERWRRIDELVQVDQYFMLLDWTGRELRADKRGAIPEHLAPIVERLGLLA